MNEYSFGRHDVPLPSELTQYQLSLKAGINPVRVAAADWPVYKLYIFGGPFGGPIGGPKELVKPVLCTVEAAIL